MEKNCFNCSKCSEHYPSFKDTCDLDEHEIKDVFMENCECFEESEAANDTVPE